MRRTGGFYVLRLRLPRPERKHGPPMIRWMLSYFAFAALPLIITALQASVLRYDASTQIILELFVFCLAVAMALFVDELDSVGSRNGAEAFAMWFVICGIVAAIMYSSFALAPIMHRPPNASPVLIGCFVAAVIMSSLGSRISRGYR